MHRFKSLTTAAVAVAVVASVAFAVAPATAAPSSAVKASTAAVGDGTSPSPADRVIDRTSERIPIDVTAVNTLKARQLNASDGGQAIAIKPVPLPDGVVLKPGETIQVNYADGVAVHTAIAAGCSSTSTVDTPYVSGGYAWSYHTHGLSTGCSGSAYVNGILSSLAWPNWWQRDFETVNVTPGSTLYWATNRKCVNSGSTTWHSENAIGSSDTALSPDKNLACNPG